MLASNECRIFLSSLLITVHQNILRPVTFYGWKTWCFTVRKEHTHRMEQLSNRGAKDNIELQRKEVFLVRLMHGTSAKIEWLPMAYVLCSVQRISASTEVCTLHKDSVLNETIKEPSTSSKPYILSIRTENIQQFLKEDQINRYFSGFQLCSADPGVSQFPLFRKYISFTIKSVKIIPMILNWISCFPPHLCE